MNDEGPEEDHWDQGDEWNWWEGQDEDWWSEKEDNAGAPAPGELLSTDVANAPVPGVGESEQEGGGDAKNSRDKPLVDAPEFGEKIKDTDKVPRWIPGAFPTIFQNETGDPYYWELVEPEMDTWGPHILRSKGWFAQTHMTFMYWYRNMMERHHVLSAKKWYVRDNPEATGYTAQDLAKMNVGQLAKQMVGYTANLPGTKASKAKLRKLILAMVKQIEIETRTTPPHTRDEWSDGGAHTPTASAASPGSLGDVPCLFGTLTTQRYQWDEIIRIIAQVEEGIEDHRNLSKNKRRELVNKYPLFVAWYCAVRLELSLKTVVVPVFGASNYVAVFEWSPTGGMVHLHYILWKRGAPRFDLRAERIVEQADVLRKAGYVGGGEVQCSISDVVDFFAEYISEWNPNKKIVDGAPAPVDEEEEAARIARRINQNHRHTASFSVQEMLHLLQDENVEEREAFYKQQVDEENLHDFHYPDPCGPPNPSQPCARLLKGTSNMWYCSNGYPRELVCEPCDQAVAQDEMRSDLWRCNLCRNCPVMNSHMPAANVGAQSNTDAQGVCTKHQAEMYCCKYCSKHHKRMGARSVLYEVLDDMERQDGSARQKFCDAFTERTLGGKLHKTFMAEIGEEVCQAEVAHHVNKCPEYFCSRPEKHVFLYKKALAVDTEKRKRRKRNVQWEDNDDDWDDWWEDEGGDPEHAPKKATKPSDVDLYEGRTWYQFEEGTLVSSHLPPATTPEEQVAKASVYEFFRLVKFHGGKNPYLSWHDEDSMPIVTLSPAVKLKEGPNFAFGARWALMQYHPWSDRRQFLDMTDAEVKSKFRTWIAEPSCPWYVLEQYLSESGRPMRERSRKPRRSADSKDVDAPALDEEDAEDEIPALVESEEEEEDEEERAEKAAAEEDVHVLKMLYAGHLAEASRRDAQSRKAGLFNRKHDCYKNTRVTDTAQENSSAMPAGVFNINEDSSDDEEYFGEQKEIAKEMQELRAAQHWVNQSGWNAAGEGRAVSSATGKEIDLRLDWDDVRKKLAKGSGAEINDAPALVDAERSAREYPLEDLDPTQRVFADRVLEWAAEVVRVYQRVASTGKWRLRVPRLRTWLGGSAGSGKSTTLRTVVAHIRWLFQREAVPATVALTAYTGVAAFNIGFGAMTACSSFQIFPNATWKSELSGEALRQLEARWSSVVLLIIDEVSFIGRAFFARMHHRVQQAKRRFFSESGLSPHDYTFGNLAIILVGDFGQLEPIDDWSMCDTETTYYTCPKNMYHLWKHQREGRALLGTFKEAVMLSNIHRSKEDLWWTESCLRLRDFECTKAGDWDIWQLHDLDRGHLDKQQTQYFEDQAVWLCALCEDVGERNGRKLAHMAQDEKKLIHQIHADHSRNSKSLKKSPSSAFDGLREVINLVKGCKVMITRNVAYLYGLANGTRGHLVGVVYGPAGIGSMPEAVVVDIPEYKGPCFYPGEPTWVPLLPMTSTKKNTRMTRTQFPLVAGFALTVNKAQGLTIKEGVVINLRGGPRFKPASKHGLPFVAFTRSPSFALTAFKNLPGWNEFAKGRESSMLRQRLQFQKTLEELHVQTLAAHSKLKTPQDEAAAYELWKKEEASKPPRQEQAKTTMRCPACDGSALAPAV